MRTSKKHFLLMPIPAFGHIIPLLELGKKIAEHHHVTFALSEYMTKAMEERELTHIQNLPFIGIPDGLWVESRVNIQANLETNRNLQTEIIHKVIPGVKSLLEFIPAGGNAIAPGSEGDALGITLPVDVVIVDIAIQEAMEVCQERKITYYFFNTELPAVSLGVFFNQEYQNGNSFAEASTPNTPLPAKDDMMQFLALPINKSFHSVAGIILNSVREFETDALELMKRIPVLSEIPLRFVGPLVPTMETTSVITLEKKEKVKQWLDRKKNKTVIYVSFGTIAVPPPKQISEIAVALLKLGKYFIWSFCSEYQPHLPDKITSKIKKQFTEDGQFLILPWAPQILILHHPATAVFVSHCGWNSTLDSVSAGVPVVAWPLFGDQNANADWLIKRLMATKVEGIELSGPSKKVIAAKEIEMAVLKVAGWYDTTANNSYREAVQEWKEKAKVANEPGGSSDVDFNDLITFSD